MNGDWRKLFFKRYKNGLLLSALSQSAKLTWSSTKEGLIIIVVFGIQKRLL